MSFSPIIIWLRRNLRLSDNPPLFHAAQSGAQILLTYIRDDNEHPWELGAASKWYLRESLISLENDLRQKYNIKLILQHGDPLTCLVGLSESLNSQTVYWDRNYEPYTINRDKKVQTILESKGIMVKTFNCSLIKEPWEILNQTKQPFKVYSPFWRKFKTLPVRQILPSPKKIKGVDYATSSTIDELFPLPMIPWHNKLANKWTAGEKEAKAQLKHFLTKKIKNYKQNRDYPSLSHTSMLSPHLHFGEISPVQIWHATMTVQHDYAGLAEDVDCFLSELAWREYSYNLLYHWPQLPEAPMKSSFHAYPWQPNSSLLTRWQKGLTGYPIIDAGMRQLWQTGWMHNRVRMIVASFLIKDLHQPWQAGEAWFWDTLVDADLANNAASWQWVAGCGVDAAPFFRIFNPITQSKKFDPDGTYIKKWLPQLKDLDVKYLHSPWLAPCETLNKANIVLGIDYPLPIVDHDKERQIALKNFKNL